MSRSTPNTARNSVASAHTVANLVRVLQALRRSIKGDKDKNPQLSIAPKAAVAIVPPKKVGDTPVLICSLGRGWLARPTQPRPACLQSPKQARAYTTGSARRQIGPGPDSTLMTETYRLFGRFMITRRRRVKNSASRAATFSMLSGAKTIRIGTRPATPLYQTHVASSPSPFSRLLAAPSETAPNPTLAACQPPKTQTTTQATPKRTLPQCLPRRPRASAAPKTE